MGNNKFEYNILSIVVTNFSINLKNEYLNELNKNPTFNNFTFEINSNLKAYVEQNTIIVEIQIKIFLDQKKQVDLGYLKVHNSFITKNINQYYNESTKILKLPKDINDLLITISICHTRAILLTKCAGTFLSNVLLPIVDNNDFIPQVK